MVVTGNGGFGSDSGDGALEMAPTSKDSCRRANYPLLTKGDSDETYRRGAMLLRPKRRCSKQTSESNWWATLVPAAAVIPGPLVYIEIVAVKKFVVGSCRLCDVSICNDALRVVVWIATLRKIGCSKQAVVCINQHRIALCRLLTGWSCGMVNRSKRG